MSEKVRAAYERPETRERLRASKLGKPLPLETRERIAAANTGKRATDATKAILSERRKAIWQDPEKRKELLAAQAAGKARAKAAKA